MGSRSAAGRGAGGEGGQHQPQRDERQVGDDEVDRAADRLGGRGCARWCARARAPARRCAATRRARRSRRRRRPPRRRRGCSSTSVKPPVEAPASRARRPSTGTAEGVEGAEQLVRAPGHPAGLVGVGADDDRGAGLDAGGRLGGGLAGDGDPALGDQGDGVLAGAGQPAAHELGVEPAAPGHQSWSIVPSSRWSRACSASKTATCSATGRSVQVRRSATAPGALPPGTRPPRGARRSRRGARPGAGSGPGTGRGGTGDPERARGCRVGHGRPPLRRSGSRAGARASTSEVTGRDRRRSGALPEPVDARRGARRTCAAEPPAGGGSVPLRTARPGRARAPG